MCNVYDLRTGEVVRLKRSKEELDRIIEQKNRKKRIEALKKLFVRTAKAVGILLAEFTISIVTGLSFYVWISGRLEQMRGYRALGGEVFAAAFVTLGVFLIVDCIGGYIWERR